MKAISSESHGNRKELYIDTVGETETGKYWLEDAVPCLRTLVDGNAPLIAK